jgi:mycothiol maleylpyruvate isomerase-like protein
VTAQDLLDRELEEEEEAWRELEAAFARVPPERFEEPGVTPDGWSLKDLMFHVAAWAAECAHVLEQIGIGHPPPEQHEDTDTKNRVWFEASREMEPRDVRVAMAAARQRMRAALGELPELTTAARSWFDESGAIHYREHAAALAEWLDGS